MEPLDPSHRKILVVDDNVDAAETLSLLLAVLGFETEVAYNGQHALEVAHTVKPDLVILDINMHVMNGYQAARVIRGSTEGQRTVLVALTAMDRPQDIATARDSGFDVHMCKPVDGDRLMEVIEQSLGPAPAH